MNVCFRHCGTSCACSFKSAPLFLCLKGCTQQHLVTALRACLAIASLTSCLFASTLSVQAQIVPDSTLPTNSAITPNDSTITISGGTLDNARINLFHSFAQFSVLSGQTAYFNNELSVQNILTRVTGGNISTIDGLIQANGTANLFFINPNGIVFGSNAQLNIGGSFIASTASSIKLADGSEFSATNPQVPPLLTINVPLGLQFGANPGAIAISGNGHDFTGGPPPFLFPLQRGNSNTGLRVQPGKTIALVGGDINLSGGIIAAPSGRIELGSVKDGSVSLNPTVSGWSLGYSGVQNYGDIQLTSRALVDVSGAGSGSIFVQTGSLRMRDASLILSQNFAPLPPGAIAINASRLVELSDPNGDGTINSSILSEALGGPGANIAISSRRLVISDGSDIGAFTYIPTKGGNITLNTTQSTEITGFSPANPINVSAITNFNFGAGQGGDTTLFTERLRIDGGASVGSTTIGTGNSGSVHIRATNTIEIAGVQPTTLLPSNVNVTTLGSGNAGNLKLEGASLTVRDGGRVEGSTLASGDAANVTIIASDFVEISGKPPRSINPSFVASSGTIQDESIRRLVGLPDVPSGNAGDVTINTPILRVFDGGLANVRNDGVGNAGTLAVNAKLVLLDRSGSLTAATSSGGGGNISVQAQDIILRNGSSISTNAGSSNGGDITINTDTLVAVPKENSDITANAKAGSGGRVRISAQGIFGTQFRDRLTPLSDITATSELGLQFNGTVQVDIRGVDPSRGLTELPETFADSGDPIAQTCSSQSKNNRFAVTGRGGLPPTPGEALNPTPGWIDWRVSPRRGGTSVSALGDEQTRGRDEITNHQSQIPNPLVEATGWVKDADGTVRLVAKPSVGVSSQPHDSHNCRGDLFPFP
jgi:filamentous hemagglutinin family protein